MVVGRMQESRVQLVLSSLGRKIGKPGDDINAMSEPGNLWFAGYEYR